MRVSVRGCNRTGGAKPVLLSREAGSGMEVQGLFVRRGGQIALDLTFVNHTAAPMSDFGIQFNKNRHAPPTASSREGTRLSPATCAREGVCVYVGGWAFQQRDLRCTWSLCVCR
jgi:hypothetical protein